MQKEEPAEKNDQETSVAASEQEKTGKKRKKKAEQAETAKDLPETVMPPKKRQPKIKKWTDRGSDHCHSGWWRVAAAAAAAHQYQALSRLARRPDRIDVEQYAGYQRHACSSEVEEVSVLPRSAAHWVQQVCAGSEGHAGDCGRNDCVRVDTRNAGEQRQEQAQTDSRTGQRLRLSGCGPGGPGQERPVEAVRGNPQFWRF